MKTIGDYNHLIRVNGRRSVLGCGHTPQEAIKNAFDAACETWADNAHIFNFLRPTPAHKSLKRNKTEPVA